MKYKTILILLFFSLLSCEKIISKKTNDNISVKTIEKKVNSQNIVPIFIGLSPNMSDEVFDEKIKKLNEDGKLVDGEFVITVKNKNYPFQVLKTNNSIRLKYSTQETKAFENVSYAISENYLSIYKNKKNDIIEIFDLKYKLNKTQIPTNIYLPIYHLEKENYKLYKDQLKSILVGYTMIGGIYPSLEEREIEKRKKEEKVSDDPLANIGDFIRSEKSNYAQFGMEIEINYYENTEMERILKKMLDESSEVKNAEDKIFKKEKSQKNSAKNNINEL